MSEPADARIHTALGRLLDLAPPARLEWLLREFPNDPEIRAQLLASVGHQAGATLPRVAVTLARPVEEPVPEQIGRYRVDRVLGQGGMGRVFLARDETVGRFVTIKQLRHDLRETELAARVRREAQASGRLQHPNIVTLYDVEEFEGHTCIVMEYVEGRTLSDVIDSRERMPLARKLAIIEQLCAALAHAHLKGIVHRDVKPANVMLDAAGQVKVLDFGIAKALDRDAGPATLVTSEYTVLGTTGYIAPEHLAGAPATQKADMFAAAVVAYELITYVGPFGTIPSQIPGRTLHGDITPMEAHGVAVSASLEQIVIRGLAVRPEQRFSDMSAMQRAFVDIREELANSVAQLSTASTEATPTSYRVPLTVGVAAVVIVVGIAWTMSGDGKTTEAPTPAVSSTTELSEPVQGNLPRRPEARAAGAPVSRVPAPIDDRGGTLESPPNEAKTVDAQPASTVSTEAAPSPTGHSATPAPQETETLGNGAPVGMIDAVEALKAQQDGVQRALRAFERAFQELSTPALRRINPTVTPQQLAFWDRTFLDSRSFEVRVTSDRMTSLSDTRVRVEGSITQVSVSKGGAPRRITNPVTMVLEKSDGDWFIASIRGNGWQ